MTRPSDEILNAYVDDALAPAQAAEVAAYLETDEETRRFCEMLRKADALTLDAFAGAMQQPPPQSLVDAIMKAPVGTNRPTSDTDVVPLASRWRRAGPLSSALLPLAAVLVLSVVAGLLALALLRPDARSPDLLAMGPVDQAAPLARLLETARRGVVVEAVDRAGIAGRLSVVTTFRDKSDRYCREVEVLPTGSDPNPLSLGIACRGSGGRWTIEGFARVAERTPPATPGFELSGSHGDESLSALIEKLGITGALSAAEEEAKVQSGWK